jgi:serine/threonine protein phosphatase PrpC
MVTDEEIHQAVLEGGELEEICSRLVDMANERGGLDNVTAVVFFFAKEEKGLLHKLFGSK